MVTLHKNSNILHFETEILLFVFLEQLHVYYF